MRILIKLLENRYKNIKLKIGHTVSSRNLLTGAAESRKNLKRIFYKK